MAKLTENGLTGLALRVTPRILETVSAKVKALFPEPLSLAAGDSVQYGESMAGFAIGRRDARGDDLKQAAGVVLRGGGGCVFAVMLATGLAA